MLPPANFFFFLIQKKKISMLESRSYAIKTKQKDWQSTKALCFTIWKILRKNITKREKENLKKKDQ